MINNYNKLRKEILLFNKWKEYTIEDIINVEYKNELNKYKNNSKIEIWIILELSYIIFFYGAGVTGRKNIKSVLDKKYNKEYLKQLVNFLSNKPVEYNTSLVTKQNWKKIFSNFSNFDNPNNASFDKYYNGHQSNLGHYYRHIFMIIKYINGQKIYIFGKMGIFEIIENTIIQS